MKVKFETLQFGLHCQSEDIDNAAHGPVLPPHGATPVHLAVPVAGGGHGQPGAVLLQENAGDHVLVGLLELAQRAYAALHYGVHPAAHSCI